MYNLSLIIKIILIYYFLGLSVGIIKNGYFIMQSWLIILSTLEIESPLG